MDTLEKIKLLREYIGSNPEALDLNFINDLSSFPFHWNSKVMDHLHLFAKTGTGSYIGFWSLKETVNDTSVDLPLVWIDNEGVPISVFAQSFDEFLSLIHYDTGLIYEILIDDYFFKSDPDGYENPRVKFNEQYVKKYLKTLEKTKSPYFKKFRIWLNNNFNIQESNNPVSIINDTVIHNQDFKKWVETTNN